VRALGCHPERGGEGGREAKDPEVESRSGGGTRVRKSQKSETRIHKLERRGGFLTSERVSGKNLVIFRQNLSTALFEVTEEEVIAPDQRT
jgi:hypothetical protein